MPVFDIIGDVHGQHRMLVALLDQLGYEEKGGAYAHDEADRTAIFVGDLIDRGEHQRETVDLVRAMAETGSARVVMGNHEFNALSWATHSDASDDGWARPHAEDKRRQHAAYLEAVGEGSDRHQEDLAWFRTLPLWLDEPGVPRVVHACWHEPAMEVIAQALGGRPMDDDFIRQANNPDTDLHQAVEDVLKGPEVPLGGETFTLEGISRSEVRITWWDLADPVLHKVAVVPWGVDVGTLPATDLSDRVAPYRYPSDAPPVYFGHYWCRGEPTYLAPNAVCLDYSAAKGHSLVACTVDPAKPGLGEFTVEIGPEGP